MSLYLAIFDDDKEVVGCLFGHYSDFGAFRDIASSAGDRARYPTLLMHSDCDGEWSPAEAGRLKNELHELAEIFKKRRALSLNGAFEHTAEYRRDALSLYDCFHTVEGANVFEALIGLCDESERLGLPILFQ